MIINTETEGCINQRVHFQYLDHFSHAALELSKERGPFVLPWMSSGDRELLLLKSSGQSGVHIAHFIRSVYTVIRRGVTDGCGSERCDTRYVCDRDLFRRFMFTRSSLSTSHATPCTLAHRAQARGTVFTFHHLYRGYSVPVHDE